MVQGNWVGIDDVALTRPITGICDMNNDLNELFSLSPERHELLTLLLQESGIDVSRLFIIPQGRETTVFPLSFAQQQLWFLNQWLPDNSAYNELVAVRLCGRLNIVVFEQSLDAIIRRHEALRTTFSLIDGRPMQTIGAPAPIALLLIELSGSSAVEQEAVVQQLATREAQRPFDLGRGPLLRVTLLRLGAEEHVVFLTMHHIVADGWSMGVFVRELVALYEAFSAGTSSRLPELPIQYVDFACWQRQWLQGEIFQAQLAYWRAQLGDLGPLRLPTDRPRPAVQTFRGARWSFTLPGLLSASLRSQSQQEGYTLFMTLLAAWKLLLYVHSGQDDIVVGTDVANRSRIETEGLIGFFVNQLVLRTSLSGNPPIRELLRRIHDVTLEAYAHQDLPFDRLVEALNIPRDLSRTPLFQVKFVLQNPPISAMELPGLTLQLMEFNRGTAKFDLLCNMWDTSAGLVGALDYNTDLFDAITIIRMVEHFEIILHQIVAQPDIRLDMLVEYLAETDRQQQISRQKERKTTNLQKLERAIRKTAPTRPTEIKNPP
jgi:Condensation domain